MNMTPRVIILETASEGAGSSEGRGAAVEKSRAGLQSEFSSGSEVHRDVHRTEANAPVVPAPSPSTIVDHEALAWCQPLVQEPMRLAVL